MQTSSAWTSEFAKSSDWRARARASLMNRVAAEPRIPVPRRFETPAAARSVSAIQVIPPRAMERLERAHGRQLRIIKPPKNFPRNAAKPVRRNAIYVPRQFTTYDTLTASEKSRLYRMAETIERRTKATGRRIGCLGDSGLRILHCLLFDYMGATGRCDPSYAALRARLGYCRQTIATALERLAAANLVKVERRMSKFRNEAGVVVLRQITNAYTFPLAKTHNLVPIPTAPSPERKARREFRQQFQASPPTGEDSKELGSDKPHHFADRLIPFDP